MADLKGDTNGTTTNGTPDTGVTLKEKIAEGRRGSTLWNDDAKRRASVAQLTSNEAGE